MKRENFPSRRAARRDIGEARNKEWAKLSPQVKLEALDRRLGKDVGAVKQRARLMKELARL